MIQNNKGFVSIYNGGQSDDGYLTQVVAYENSKQQDWTASGFFDSSIAQCGNKIVGLTNIKNLNAEIRQSLSEKDYTDALIQLYPRPQNASETVIAVVNAGDKYEYLYGMESIPCIDGKMFVLARKFQVDEGESSISDSSEMLVLDTNTGHTKTISLSYPKGNIDEFNSGQRNVLEGHVSADKKHFNWISPVDGTVRSVNLETGVVADILDIPKFEASRPVMTEKSVFVVNKSDLDDSVYRLRRYDLATGEEQEYFTVRNVPSSNTETGKGHLMSVALNPTWVAEQERS